MARPRRAGPCAGGAAFGLSCAQPWAGRLAPGPRPAAANAAPRRGMRLRRIPRAAP